ncbi:MAG: sigma-70 family RNA polymerase sigma factor [Verrucomicrobia bacterium]|nr:sigma-70 family RNA polymerase sigma factor [Verrucomicrobiota bacterium]
MSASGASFGFDRNSAFESTRWSVVIRARGPETSRESREALNYLCRAYWYPLFAYARRQGSLPHDAQDLTQGFFAYLLQQNLFSGADPKRGRLRTFLLTAFSRYMTREWHRIHAQKRGGHQVIESLDEEFAEGEHRYRHEAVEQMTAEQLFARSWSQSILDTALETIRKREYDAGRKELFRRLEPFLQVDRDPGVTYSRAAAELGMSEPAVRQTVHRLREKYRQAVRDRIADTLADASEKEIDEELRCIRRAMS